MDHTTSDVVRDRRRVAVPRDLAILDTPAETAYDDIARLATAGCQSPTAGETRTLSTATVGPSLTNACRIPTSARTRSPAAAVALGRR